MNIRELDIVCSRILCRCVCHNINAYVYNMCCFILYSLTNKNQYVVYILTNKDI